MDKLISVVVPIYNIERYIGLCIESIIKQTYTNLEIILVDDGSTDRSSELCDLYALKDSRIKVVHKHNGGLVSARKAGVCEATGEYISYVDGDDWIEPDFIESLYRKAIAYDADVVCAGFSRDLFDKTTKMYNVIEQGVYDGRKLFFLLDNMISEGRFYRSGITTYVWNKLFKKTIVANIQYQVDENITLGEDAAVTYPALLKSKRIIVTRNVSYHYRQREDSMLKKNNVLSTDLKKLKDLYDYLKKWASQSTKVQGLQEQIDDYILANIIMRSGGMISEKRYSTYDVSFFGKKVVVYSAGTFGQQLVYRLRESNTGNLIGWIDDDYWEYRRCCLDVDAVETIADLSFDYILIAKIEDVEVEQICNRLMNMGIDKKRILSVTVPDEKRTYIKNSFEPVRNI